MCAPERRKRLIAQAIGGEPNTFVTLTVKPRPGESPETRARSLVYAWRTIRRRASSKHCQIDAADLEEWQSDPRWRSKASRPRTKAGLEHPDNGTIPFLAVFERTKKGEPHLHILCRAEWLPQKWLSREMDRLTGAPVVDVRRINSAAKLAGYAAKYCGKDPQPFGTCKRYWASQDYEIEKPAELEERQHDGATFEIFRGDALEWSTQKEREGWMVQWIGDRLTAFDMRKPPAAAASPPYAGRSPPSAASADRTSQASDPQASA